MTAMVSDAAVGTDRRRSGRLRRNKKHRAQLVQREAEEGRSHERWRSELQHKLYSAKLMEALARLRLAGDGGGGGGGEEVRVVPTRGRTVRDAADRALAFAAKGRTRWSRAVLMTTANRVKLKFRRIRAGGGKGRLGVTGAGGGRWMGRKGKGKVSVGRLRGKGSAGVRRKVRELGSLVPGCRVEPMNVVLEEATDYIAALEMQVRTMSALAQLLSGGDSDAAPAAGHGHTSS
ncbi:hypothetical protein MLD38_036010 [Melastoma candidum]|nr:hypothetical protein MLD38_036010 [Melastoma candidum]